MLALELLLLLDEVAGSREHNPLLARPAKAAIAVVILLVMLRTLHKYTGLRFNLPEGLLAARFHPAAPATSALMLGLCLLLAGANFVLYATRRSRAPA